MPIHPLNLAVIAVYLAAVMGVGVYFFRRQSRPGEYFVGDRKMGAGHIGLSVVATDVGGGFSIGLGGLGFAMGLSGSWLLFTGLIGAWLAAVLLIPRVKTLGDARGWTTYPEFLGHRFGGRTRLVAALVSGIGYAGFVGAQILAGAKLSAGAFDLPLTTAVWIMAAVVVLYTAFGGLQAVVYTDTVQWIILLVGLLALAVPFGWVEVGGWQGMAAALPEGHMSLWNVSPLEVLTWAVTIVPIWFVGMTLYQRIYATRDVETARRAWFFAGLLEWPLMAFAGALLGMMGRVLFPEVESEMGLPLLIKNVLPIGVAGLVLAAYFSAIMSTADSCLLASVGNVVDDLVRQHVAPGLSQRAALWLSRGLTVAIGLASVVVALSLPKVLDAILLSYAFMVSGLFVPTLAGLFWRRAGGAAALASMVAGGGTAVVLAVVQQRPGWLLPVLERLPAALAAEGALPMTVEPILVALPLSAVVLAVVALAAPARDA